MAPPVQPGGMARIALADLAEVDDPDVQAIHDHLMATRDRDWSSEHWEMEANFPPVFKHMFRARRALWAEGDLPEELLEKIAIAVSMANGCSYCTGAFCTHLVTRFDYDEAAVVDFLEDVRDGTLSGRDRAVVEFAVRSLEDPKAVTDGQVEELRERHGLSDAELLQVVYTVNLLSGFNRIVDTFDAAYDHQFPEELVRTGVGL